MARPGRSEQQPHHPHALSPRLPGGTDMASRRRRRGGQGLFPRCQLPVHGPVRRAARACLQVITFSRTLLTHSRCQPDLHASGATQASSCASAPQPVELNPTPAVILSLGSRLARRFARSLHLHPYNCALFHGCMPPCFARVLLLSPPRFPLGLANN
jgi:hypothetical protein